MPHSLFPAPEALLCSLAFASPCYRWCALSEQPAPVCVGVSSKEPALQASAPLPSAVQLNSSALRGCLLWGFGGGGFFWVNECGYLLLFLQRIFWGWENWLWLIISTLVACSSCTRFFQSQSKYSLDLGGRHCKDIHQRYTCDLEKVCTIF